MRRMSGNDIVVSADDRLIPSEAPARPAPRREAKPKTKAKRKAPRPRFDLTPLQRLAAGGVALTALVVGAAILWHSGIIQRTAQETANAIFAATAKAGFRIQEITVTGRSRTPLDDIATALAAGHGAPILAVDLERVKDRLEALPSVRMAAVERRLPGSLHLALVEREPVAIWQNNGQHLLVDRDGHQIPGSIAGYESLPLVVGDGAGTRASELLALLDEEPQLAPRVRAAIRVSNRRWNLMLDDAVNGLEVRLPEDQPLEAWHRLAQLDRERGLTRRQVSMIDLRIPDRMVLKTERPASPAEAAKRKDDGA